MQAWKRLLQMKITVSLGKHHCFFASGGELVSLAQRAGMTKQAMAALVTQCEAWGMVQREDDPRDARARRIVFTASGLAWLQAYQAAVEQAQAELAEAVGDEVATVVALGLEAYCGH